jgi:hypothetical protein
MNDAVDVVPYMIKSRALARGVYKSNENWDSTTWRWL